MRDLEWRRGGENHASNTWMHISMSTSTHHQRKCEPARHTIHQHNLTLAGMSKKIDLSLFRGDDSDDEVDVIPVKVSSPMPAPRGSLCGMSCC